MPCRAKLRSTAMVALLAEGVDRNQYGWFEQLFQYGSPSSRRAWIEIYSRYCGSRKGGVALLAEGVDRNSTSYM